MQNKKILISGFILIAILLVGIFIFTNQENGEDLSLNTPREKETYVYETPVDGPDECTSYEKYDEQNSICYFECENEQQCLETENLINNEFESWVESGETTKNISEDGESTDENLLAKYSVSASEKISFMEGTDKKEYTDIWEEVAALSPNTLSNKFIETFEIYNNPTDDTLAFVDDADQNGKWRISINYPVHKGEDLRQQKSTLVHELSHILALNSDQLENIEDCRFLKLQEGCAKQNSYINSFYEKFWKGIDVETAQEYIKNEYVSEYAATSGVEDFSESFAYFVLEKNIKDLGNSQRDEKIKFFYQYSELVSLRSDMRNELGRDIVRAKKSLD